MCDKRMIVAVETVMTLMSGVYYCAKAKEYDNTIKTVLIWENTTQYNIPIQSFSECFDEIYMVPANLCPLNILSPEAVKQNLLCRYYLMSSGIEKMLRDTYSREILMLATDASILTKNIITIFNAKRNKHKKIILFEDGMALYSEKKRTIRDIIDYNLGREIDRQSVIGACNKIQTIFCQHPEQLPEWKANHRKIIRQSDLFSNVDLWGRLLKDNKSIGKLQRAIAGKKILLYLGQPIAEFSAKFRIREEIDFIHGILKSIPDDYIVLIKAHPRDSRSKYRILEKEEKCVLFDNHIGWIPIEFLLNLISVSVVVTFASTAALNILERNPECRVIYTYRYFNIDIPETWKEMYKKYDGYAVMPATMDELADTVSANIEPRQIIANTSKKDVQYIIKYLTGRNVL